MVKQFEIELPGFKRGFHLITPIIEKELKDMPDQGLLNILVKHTSAAITLNENADPDVRRDFNSFINRLVPENMDYYAHVLEGADDMPAHIKSSLFGQSLTIPISNGRLNLGTWQGIYLCEFRNNADRRKLFLTLISS